MTSSSVSAVSAPLTVAPSLVVPIGLHLVRNIDGMPKPRECPEVDDPKAARLCRYAVWCCAPTVEGVYPNGGEIIVPVLRNSEGLYQQVVVDGFELHESGKTWRVVWHDGGAQ